jgi:hypothetical protein
LHQDGKGCAQPMLAAKKTKLVHNKSKHYCYTCWVAFAARPLFYLC